MQDHEFNQALIRLFRERKLFAFVKPGQSLDDPTLVAPEHLDTFLRWNPNAQDVTYEALKKLFQ